MSDRINNAIKRFEEEKIDVNVKNQQQLEVIEFSGNFVDFWPSTGKFIPRKDKLASSNGLEKSN